MRSTRTIRVVFSDNEKSFLMKLIKIHRFKNVSEYARYKLFNYEKNLEKIISLYLMITKNANE